MFSYVVSVAYDEYGIIIRNIHQECYESGYWTRQYLMDDEGNVLDYEDVITAKDLQAYADEVLGIDIDVINY